MRAVEAEYKCRLHKLTLIDRHSLRHSEPGVSREAPPLKMKCPSDINKEKFKTYK